MTPAAAPMGDPVGVGDQYDVQVSVDDRAPEWNEFLERCEGGHHEQTTMWGRLKGCYGWQPIRAEVRKKGRVVGGLQLLWKHLGELGRIGYVMRGPCVEGNDPRAIDFVFEQLDQIAKRVRLAYVAVVPPYDGRKFDHALKNLGFRRKPDSLPPGGVMTATLILDVSQSVGDLLAHQRATTRKHIHRAMRAGVRIREGTTADDVETFRRLMYALCERRGTSPTPPQRDFFENLWSIFRDTGSVKLFIAEQEQRAVSAMIAFPFGKTVRAWKTGWAGDCAKSYPNELLMWEAIQWSKLRGYRFFDFVQLDRHAAESVLSNRPIDGKPSEARSPNLQSATFFKLGFGGTPVLLPPPYYRVYHPAASVLMGCGAARVIESRLFASVAGRLWNRIGTGEQ